MFKFVSGFLLIGSAVALLYVKFPINYYMQPKQERLYRHWKNDINKLSIDKKFAGVFEKVGKVEVHFTDPQVATEFEKFRTPFKVYKGQPFVLRISVTRWIEKTEYGFVVQHELFDETDDKIYEFGRTYKVGRIF